MISRYKSMWLHIYQQLIRHVARCMSPPRQPVVPCLREQSVCSSVNEIACHAIPDDRPLQDGDLVSFDVSVFFKVGREG